MGGVAGGRAPSRVWRSRMAANGHKQTLTIGPSHGEGVEQRDGLAIDKTGGCMWYCPNCDKQIESDAVADCSFCRASFGEGSSWKPMSVLPTRRRNGATVVLLFAALGPIAGAVISSLWIFLMTAE